MTISYPLQLSTQPKNVVSLVLEKSSLINLKPPKGGVQVEVECGSLWITQEGDLADYVLREGERYVASSSEMVLVQALDCSRFQVRTLE